MSHQKKKRVVRTLAWISAAIVLIDILFFLWAASDAAPLDAGSGLGLALITFLFVLPVLGIVLGAWLLWGIAWLFGWLVEVFDRRRAERALETRQQKRKAGSKPDPEDW